MSGSRKHQQAETRVIDAAGMAELIRDLAARIVRENPDLTDVTLVGIRSRGAHLAGRIAVRIRETTGVVLPVGILDISLYRDDLRSRIDQPELIRTEIPGPLEDHNIILVDDVLFTGRTIRAALDGIMDLGRARKIQLAVLVDRGHRELPIRANYTGQYIPTSLEQTIRVRFSEDGEEDGVILRELGK
ncbi:MAG: bifunctional pyr operon transcriptional regulator/uracil phosphoribosyltransferase PyrR [Deltaproteobacteria bacterium]|nr:bifunctional pyr operon transcriptional regulator/uracil phosphoribosyltransferase PyrR [Deltaproteobacteria bacterium]